LQARTLADAVLEILERGAGFHPSVPIPEIHSAILEREAQGSTAIANGVAIPHARVSSLDDFHLLLGVASAPLEDKGSDGQPIDLVFLILSNDKKNIVMLQTLATLVGLAADSELLALLREAGTSDAIWKRIEEAGLRVKKGLFARDLMQKTPVIAREEMPLRELLDQFFEHGVHKAPVCGPGGDIVGAVTSEEILAAGFPDYMSGLPDIAFLDEYSPFEEFFKRETTATVKDIQDRIPLIVDADAPMIQVAFRMKQENQRFAYVQEDGRYVGVIDRADVLSRILRA
jgi:mannitol/fructose-specific phosphotransferase system IIA component (Ntr-type)